MNARRIQTVVIVAVMILAGLLVVCDAAPAPRTSRGVIWGTEVDSLRVGVSADGNKLVLRMHNVGSEAVRAVSHADDGGTHLVSFRLEIITPTGDTRTVALSDTSGSSPTVVTLEPGKDLSHTVDIVEWSGRAVNDSDELKPGLYVLSVIYEVASGDAKNAWTGKISVGPVKHEIE